jgi:hypothetical protein
MLDYEQCQLRMKNKLSTNETTTPAISARGARRVALGPGPWVRGLAPFSHIDWAQQPLPLVRDPSKTVQPQLNQGAL